MVIFLWGRFEGCCLCFWVYLTWCLVTTISNIRFQDGISRSLACNYLPSVDSRGWDLWLCFQGTCILGSSAGSIEVQIGMLLVITYLSALFGWSLLLGLYSCFQHGSGWHRVICFSILIGWLVDDQDMVLSIVRKCDRYLVVYARSVLQITDQDGVLIVASLFLWFVLRGCLFGVDAWSHRYFVARLFKYRAWNGSRSCHLWQTFLFLFQGLPGGCVVGWFATWFHARSIHIMIWFKVLLSPMTA